MLIFGEPGTGKRHVARVIHQNGPGTRPADGRLRLRGTPRRGSRARAIRGRKHRESSSREPRRPARSRGRPRLALGEGSTLLIREIFKLPRDLQARLAASLDSSVRLIGTTVIDPEMRSGERADPAGSLLRADHAGHSLAAAARAPR